MENFLGGYYSSQELQKLEELLKFPPLCTTIRVNTLKASVEESKRRLQNYFISHNELFKVEVHTDFPDILIIPSLGPNCVKPIEKEIIVDCSSGSSILRGADLYAAGIIGMNENILKNDIVSVWADISGNCSKGFKKTYMDKKYFIGNGICQLDRASIFGDIKKSSLGIGVKMTEMKFKMPSLNGVMPEALFLQNLPSIAVSRFLNPIYNSRVLDMCASPGGKTCHTAALMNNTGTIFALDKIQKKTIAIQQNCDRLGIENVQVITSDSSMLIENGIFEAESFDYIILDPPCSGLGLRPNLKISVSEFDNATSFAPYQRKLFQQAWALLKPGGRMSYSTCTLNPLENEVLVEKMLNIFKNSKLAPIRSGILEKYCLPGLVTGSLSQEICETSICRFYPSAEHDTIGFFFVIFEKTANKID